MGDGAQARAATQRRPAVGVGLARIGLSGVDPHPQPRPGTARVGSGHEGALDILCGGDGVGGRREHGHRSFALAQAVEAETVLGCGRGIDDPVESMPAGGARFDLRQQERRRPGRPVRSILRCHRPRLSPPSGPRHDIRQRRVAYITHLGDEDDECRGIANAPSWATRCRCRPP